MSVHGLLHGDVWEFRRRWDGTNNQIRAVGGLEARVQVNGYLDPKSNLNKSDDCADLDDWMCTDTLRVDSANEEFVTVTEGGERWTVHGNITNISGSESDTHAIAANYIQDGTIDGGSFNGFVQLGPGETDDYRIEFGRTQPPGELRLTLLDEL